MKLHVRVRVYTYKTRGIHLGNDCYYSVQKHTLKSFATKCLDVRGNTEQIWLLCNLAFLGQTSEISVSPGWTCNSDKGDKMYKRKFPLRKLPLKIPRRLEPYTLASFGIGGFFYHKCITLLHVGLSN